MTVEHIVTDDGLKTVLSVSAEARTQALTLLATVSASSVPPTEEEQLQVSQQQKILYGYLAQLRGLARDAAFSGRDTKVLTAEARQEVDRLHLQLQNLFYEQKHLQSEIADCENYDHKYLQLPLIPVEEFLELFPEHGESDEITLTVARIEHEHAEREKLEQQRQALLKKKQGLMADNKKRKDDLASLDKQLENFIDAAKPIQKLLEKV